MIRVLTDGSHHGDLYESLCMLFEDRFGWELYRPAGMEFWDEGLWNYERHMPHGIEVARQYLLPWGTDSAVGDHFERVDTTHPGRIHKLVTLEQVRSQPFDIILATLAENEEGFASLARSIGARFGIQTGNEGTINRYDLADFCMFSTAREHTPWVPHVFYHQEFSLADFRFEYPPTENDVAATWVQCLSSAPEDWQRFETLAHATPELRWFHHGHCCQDCGYWRSNVQTTPEVAAQMRAARIGVHFKRWSDGYGHVIHNLFAVGKPVIATASYYTDKLAGPLFVDGVTSFDVQTRSTDEVVAIVRRLAQDDDYHRQISENAAARFREVVDFDADAGAIRGMLDGVLSDPVAA
jgi:hypothetical protein